MKIGNFDTDENVLVVAEIGNNHEGNFEIAQQLVRKAAECRVDAVKFQTFQTKYFVSASDPVRFNRLRSFELTYKQFADLQQLAVSLGMLFLSTPLDLESAQFLAEYVNAYKIASGDNNFYPLIELACTTGKPIIVSSGASDLAQIIKTKQFIVQQWKARGIQQEVAFLHCVSSYPVPSDQANLSVIGRLARELGGTVGYSDHTLGNEACVLAVASGARIIEKHFTLDKNQSDFRDHKLSADPAEMEALVTRIHNASLLMGKPDKIVQECERPLYQLIRRSITAATDLRGGHQIRHEDLLWLRPGGGLPSGEEYCLIGKALKVDVKIGHQIRLEDLEKE